ncbi:MAG: ABC transporter ATP-binding protein [Chthonomonas sp.]|nr:ABC transporter ATP-binding protein [Chthonomonas sp.]
MSEAAISVQNLTKIFRVSHSGSNSLKTLFLWWQRRKLESHTVLRDISFEVKRGECVAVIGSNGAGKSTTLSLIARVYKPTSGTIHVNGRVAPLLELGAGFHPDLTGAENILFNGVILGLTRAEVHGRMDAIIDFAGVREAIHAPVRTYSSGMLARLGFSIAVHVDAEILIVDEVLAVGDKDFEQKCYARIEEFRVAGGTIFFVSHNPDAVRRVANRVLWIQEGQIKMEGAPDAVLQAYLSSGPSPK